MFEVRIDNLLPWFMNNAINNLVYCETMLCQGDELHYLWQGTLSSPEHHLTVLWVQLARQLPRFNIKVPSLTLRRKSPGAECSGSVPTKSSVILERLLSSEQLLLHNEEST